MTSPDVRIKSDCINCLASRSLKASPIDRNSCEMIVFTTGIVDFAHLELLCQLDRNLIYSLIFSECEQHTINISCTPETVSASNEYSIIGVLAIGNKHYNQNSNTRGNENVNGLKFSLNESATMTA